MQKSTKIRKNRYTLLTQFTLYPLFCKIELTACVIDSKSFFPTNISITNELPKDSA